MTQEHPISPPPELVKEWSSLNWREGNQVAFAAAARWGADQELEACCEWLKGHWLNADLRAHRRPKPPSLKEQACALLDVVEKSIDSCSSWDFSVIRRALESLPE